MQEICYVDNTNIDKNTDINRRLREGWKVKMMVPTSIAVSGNSRYDYYEGGVYVVIERDD